MGMLSDSGLFRQNSSAPGERRATENSEGFGLLKAKRIQKLWSATVDVVGIDAIEFEVRAMVRPRA